MQLFSRNIYIVLTIFTFSFFGLSNNTFAVSYQNNITTGFTINESISITISNDNISINNLLPGQYADSNSIDITVTTNSPYGYTLTSTVGDISHNNRNLTHTTNSVENFASLDINSTTTNLSDFNDDKWGYSTSNDNGTTWSSYSGLPLYTDNTNVAILKETKILSTTNNKVTFKIGAKASNNKSSGIYENVINFTATTNPKHLFMQDINTWRDTLTNTGDQLTVVDIRDGKEYWVGKQADGKIWMTQNLDFEITSTPLTSDTSDLTAYNTGGYTSAAGYTQENGIIKWTPASTAITSERTVPVSTSTGDVSGLTNWTNDNYAPYSAEGGDVYVYTSNSTDADTIYTSLSSCIATSHTEAQCKHYHRGNYYNWSAAVASNNTNVEELLSNYDVRDNTAKNSICPAGWRLPIGAKADSFSQTNTEFAYLLKESNIFTSYPSGVGFYAERYVTNGFNNIRSNPLFFTRSGYVISTSLSSSGTNGSYWSSSVRSSSYAYNLDFSSSYVYPAYGSFRIIGLSVRCVARDPIYYMQDVAKWENKIPNTGDSLIAIDKRDGKEYWVGRQADGNIWMTQNLDFEITGEPLTSDTTDLTAYGDDSGYTSDAGYVKYGDIIKWMPTGKAITSERIVPVSTTTGNGSISGLAGWENDNYAPYSAEGGDVYVYTSNSTDNDTVYTSLSSCISASHTEAECKHYHRGNYYNWSAAIASNNSNVVKLTSSYNIAQNSICPAGWRLPVGQSSSTPDATTMEIGNLLYTSGITDRINAYAYASDGFNNIRSTPLYFTRSGVIHTSSLGLSGYSGLYWTSSPNSNYGGSQAHELNFNSGGVYPGNFNYRFYGYSVRCVARDPIYYMQDVAKWKNKIPNTGDSLVVKDIRDDTSYTVGRLADGNIWMLDNLAFDGTDGNGTSYIEMNRSNTNITRNVVWDSSVVGTSSSYTLPVIYTAFKNTTNSSDSLQNGEDWKYGVLYNYCATTVNDPDMCVDSVEKEATEDICPAGWRLPTGGPSGEHKALFTELGGGTGSSATNQTFIDNMRSTLRFPFAGFFEGGQGSYGYMWSSTASSDTLRSRLGIETSRVSPQWGSDRKEGFSVRCIAK